MPRGRCWQGHWGPCAEAPEPRPCSDWTQSVDSGHRVGWCCIYSPLLQRQGQGRHRESKQEPAATGLPEPQPVPGFPEGPSPTLGPGDPARPLVPCLVWLGGRGRRPEAPQALTCPLGALPVQLRPGVVAQGGVGPSPRSLPCCLPDLLLPLLLPLGPAAPLRAGEAGPRVHTLLHVPRHTLLQRQGGHVTRAGTPRTLQGLKGLPGRLPTLPTLRPDAGSRRVFTVLHPAAAAAEDTSGMSRASTPATLSSPPVGATRRSASAAGAPRVPGGCLVRAGRLSSCLSTCPAEVPPGGSATAEGLLSAVTGSAVVVRALGSLSTWGTPGDGDTYQRVWTQSSTQLPWELANPKGPQCPSPRCPEPKAPSSSPCATRARSCRALAQQHAPHCTQGSFR